MDKVEEILILENQLVEAKKLLEQLHVVVVDIHLEISLLREELKVELGHGR